MAKVSVDSVVPVDGDGDAGKAASGPAADKDLDPVKNVSRAVSAYQVKPGLLGSTCLIFRIFPVTFWSKTGIKGFIRLLGFRST